MTSIPALRTQPPAPAGPFELSKEDSMADTRTRKHSSHGALETAEFRLIFVASFIVFLLEAIALRAIPWRGRQHLPAAERKKSILAQARASIDRTIPFAFMG
jgi:hypothetical protein